MRIRLVMAAALAAGVAGAATPEEKAAAKVAADGEAMPDSPDFLPCEYDDPSALMPLVDALMVQLKAR